MCLKKTRVMADEDEFDAETRELEGDGAADARLGPVTMAQTP